MKITNFLFLITILLFTSSCSKEDLADTVVGTWKLKSIETSNCNDPDENIAPISADEEGCINILGSSACTEFVFAAGGALTINTIIDGDAESFTGTYTVDEDKETISICESGDCRGASITDDVLLISYVEDGCTVQQEYVK